MNLHARFQRLTVGFGAPTGVDPHCFEIHVPPGNGGEIHIIEHYGVAAGAFGRPAVERCILKRKTWTTIRDDVKRHFNERLKDNQMAVGTWKTGVNKVERLLGQELLVLCWAVEVRKIIESDRPFSSNPDSHFHRKRTPVFMTVDSLEALLAAHAGVASGV